VFQQRLSGLAGTPISDGVSEKKAFAASLILNVVSLQMEMKRVHFVALAIFTVIVFAGSSIWYSSLLFGRQFLELSGATAGAPRSPVKGLFELLRTVVLALGIAQLVFGLSIAAWKRAGVWGCGCV
jgi:hypothetical protein